MKILAINGSPRKNRNTGLLLKQTVEGACSKGATGELINLYSLNYKGCISCFQCKLPGGPNYGRCAVKDDLKEVLDKSHEADILVLGSPLYFSTETGMMRSFMERLWFQYYLYTSKKPPLSPRKKAAALIYTMNIKEEDIPAYRQDAVISVAKGIMEKLFAPCELLLGVDTKQFDDYSKYEVDMFDVEQKIKRHQEIFPKDLAKAFELGVKMVSEHF